MGKGTTEQVLRYENDLRFPLNIRKSSCAPSYSNMTNGSPATALHNLDNRDFEKHLSKTISFRFSSLLNLKEPESPHGQIEDSV
ncbi:hypothetical protein ACLKA6_018188 [Drosophila palustris]